MKEAEFREWLEQNGANTENGRNTRIYAVRTIEARLKDLGFDYPDLEAAWQASRLEDLRQALTGLRNDFDAGGENFKILMPQSEKPRNRLINFRNWLGQYGRFLAGEGISSSDADRIRHHVLEHYIEPARENDDDSVEFVVRDVNDALGLNEAWPNICQAMRGKKFHALADVWPPQSFGADMSTITRFRFDLDPDYYWAYELLRKTYGEPIARSKKMAAFALADGRQLAIDLEASKAQLWLEGHIPELDRTDIEVKPYVANAPRHSNLPDRLKHSGSDPRPVSLVTVSNADALETLLSQYALSADLLGVELDPKPIWIVTARWGEEDGLPRFLERGEWSLQTNTGSASNQRINEMRLGDQIVARDYFHQTHDLPFGANGKRVSAIRLRAMGTVTEVSEDGLTVGAEWEELDEPRTWYFYTYAEPVWRLKDPGESQSADRLRRFILNGEDQDYNWFLNDPFWRDRIFGAPTVQTEIPMTATNLILYGPPGTGKTYRTALEAVRLCDGNVEYTKGIEGRAALMRRYRELVDKRQIDFVTFHQNFSYEDFVEGLRPVPITNSDGESTGFHLQAESGIFRRISERAETDGFDTDGALMNISDRAVYKMSLGEVANSAFDFVFDESIANGYALFGFRDIDWTDQKFEDRDEILKTAVERFPEEKITSNKGIVQSPDVFRNQLQIGDVLVIAKGNHKFRAIGIVEGDYEYAPRPDGKYCHRRKVSWLWSNEDGLDVGELYPPKFIQKTIYRLKDAELNRPLLARLIASADGANLGVRIRQYVLIIDEINRANISKVFGELITLIEPDKRIGMQNAIKVRLPYSKKDFSVPANLHIVGTMNTADRSIALLDTALRRRFRFEELAPDPDLLNAVDGIDLSGVLRTINARVEYLLDRDHAIGHAFFMGEGAASRSAIDDTMRFKVIPLLQEYFFEDWSRIHAVLGDGFVAGTKLAPPPDLDERYAVEERKTWSVRTPFATDAYSLLLGKSKPANEIEIPGSIQ